MAGWGVQSMLRTPALRRLAMKLIQVSARCFACVNTRNLLCDANSGFLNAGEGLIVDTQSDRGHAEQMRGLFAAAAAEGLELDADDGPRELALPPRSDAWSPEIVVNTHEDIDHVAGNMLFPEARIVAHRLTSDHMATTADP
ncbi:MAG: MBL fold metallo-hydrolase, partial [Phycisphaerales bacterium]